MRFIRFASNIGPAAAVPAGPAPAPLLEPPMSIYTMHDVQNNLAKCYSLLSQCGIYKLDILPTIDEFTMY